jgi:anti-sigma factor RsiW
MNCRELREYLFAFLDSELDAPLSIEVQRHLEQCPECASEAEIERAIRRNLSQSLHDPGDGRTAIEEPNLEAVLSRITSRGMSTSTIATRLRRWVPMLATAAVIAIAVIGGVTWNSGRTHYASNQFVELLISDFEHFQERGRPLQIASADPSAVSSWLAEQTALVVALPAVQEKDGKLLGARKCKIDGKPAAFAIYDLGGTLASLVVVPGPHPDVDIMERVEQDGHIHWVDRCKGHTVLACKRGALVYAAVSTLPEDRLFALMANPER